MLIFLVDSFSASIEPPSLSALSPSSQLATANPWSIECRSRQITVAGGSRCRRGVGLLHTRELQCHFLDSYPRCSSTAGVTATALLIILLVLPFQKGAPSTEITAQAIISKSIGVFDCRTCLLLSQSLTGPRHLWNTPTTGLPKAQAETMKPEEAAKRLGVLKRRR